MWDIFAKSFMSGKTGLEEGKMATKVISNNESSTTVATTTSLKSSTNEAKNVSTRCLKITEKVSFNIASEASYVYILSGQKLIKNAKNDPFWRAFANLKLAVKQCYQTGQI